MSPLESPALGEEQDEDARARALVTAAWADGLRRESAVPLLEWIEANVVLTSESAASPGRYRFRTTPYLKELAEVLAPSCPIQHVCGRKGSQLGWSQFAAAVLGYLIDQVPGPMVYFLPTVELLKPFVAQRFQPVLDNSPRLRERVSEGRTLKGRQVDTARMKQFPGGVLALLSANSAAGLRSLTARFIFEDEVDGYPLQVGDEGDPVELVERAARSFGRRRKVFAFSTPTVLGRSRIQRLFEESDQRSYLVPCPKCGELQRLYWQDKKTGKKGVQWAGEGRGLEVWYACAACDARIEEAQKDWMLQRGVWTPKVPELSDERRGYELSALYSPASMFSWVDAVKSFQRVKDVPEKFRVWINQTLGECWEEQGDAPPWEELFERRGGYAHGTVPRGAHVLTAGADVQANRIEVEVVAWGPRLQSWSVVHEVINGDTQTSDEPWDKLTEVLARGFPSAYGYPMPVRLACVDSSWQPQRVYDYCRHRNPGRAYAVKGMDHMNVLVGLPSYVDLNYRGRRLRRGVQLWGLGVSVAKRELYGFLRGKIPVEGEPKVPFGFCHFPDEYGPEYFKQLTAEKLVRKPDRRGFMGFEWVKVHERNEVLDCRNYARAAAAIVGLDRWTDSDWARAAGGYRTATTPDSGEPRAGERGGYWDRFRRGRGR